GGMVVPGRHEDDPVPQANAPGAGCTRGQEHLGRRGVRVLLPEVALDLPGVRGPETVAQLPRRERLVDQALLAVLLPRPGKLVLVEDAELHGAGSSGGEPYSARATAVKRRRRLTIGPPILLRALMPSAPPGPGPIAAVHRLLI